MARVASAVAVGLYLALACVAVAAPATDDAQTLVVRVATAEPGDPRAVLTTADLVLALKLRLGVTPMAVVAHNGQYEGWRVTVADFGRDALDVQITAPDGRLVTNRILSVQHGRPRHTAHTIALLVVESLASLVPNLVAREVDPPRQVAPPAMPVSVSSAEHRRWAVYADLRTVLYWPTRERAYAAGMTAALIADPWFVTLGGSLGSAFRYEGEAYRVRAIPLTLHLLGGFAARRNGRSLFAAGGAAARIIWSRAGGADPQFRSERHLGWGWMAEVGAGTTVSDLQVALVLQATELVTHPRFVVDGQTVINTGRSVLGLGVRLGYGR